MRPLLASRALPSPGLEGAEMPGLRELARSRSSSAIAVLAVLATGGASSPGADPEPSKLREPVPFRRCLRDGVRLGLALLPPASRYVDTDRLETDVLGALGRAWNGERARGGVDGLLEVGGERARGDSVVADGESRESPGVPICRRCGCRCCC